MRKRAIFAWVVLAVFCIAGARAAQAGDAAMVVDMSGGQAEFAGGPRAGQPVDLMDFLAQGDRILLKRGVVLVLNYFDSGKRERLTGAGTVVIGAQTSRPESGVQVQTSNAAVKLAQPKLAASDTQHAGTVALRGVKKKKPKPRFAGELGRRRDRYLAKNIGPGKVLVMGLFDTAVTTARPMFQWRPLPDVRTYALTVWDGNGRKVWGRVADESNMSYAGPALRAGKHYRWLVVAMAGRKKVGEGVGEFWLLPIKEVKGVEGAAARIKSTRKVGDTEIHILLAGMYEKHRLYDEAARMLRRAISLHPESAGLKDRLAVLDPSAGF